MGTMKMDGEHKCNVGKLFIQILLFFTKLQTCVRQEEQHFQFYIPIRK